MPAPRYHRDRGRLHVAAYHGPSIQADRRRRGHRMGWTIVLARRLQRSIRLCVWAAGAVPSRFWSYGYDDVLDGMFVTAAVPERASPAVRAARRKWPRTCDDSAQEMIPSWQRHVRTAILAKSMRLSERLRARLQLTPGAEHGA